MALARVQYTQTSAGNRNFTVPMHYISRDDILVSVDGVDVPFSWLNDSAVQLDTAPAEGSVIDVRRETTRDELLVDFQDASTITEEQLDLSAKQAFYIAQEAFDATGGTMAVANDGSYSANNRRISNVGDPDSDDDVANVRWVKAQYQSGKDAHQERLLAEAARNAAQASESAAATSEANALSYRNITLTYRDEAEDARDAAALSEANAKTSETNAAASETASKNSETAAQAAAQAAATSEANALTYRNTANASASSASSNATSAGDSAAKASQWAELPEDVAVEPGKYSAKHHAIKASANSASAAMSATNAAAYRDTAYEHRQAAAASAADSASSATDSQNSADASATSASESAASAAEAAGYAAGLNMPNAQGKGGLFLRQNEEETGLEYAETFTRGMILMWSGGVNTVPKGWALCDGTNDTPDLRDRFIVGAGSSYVLGDTGGANEITLTTSQIPSHTHSGSIGAAGNHRHTTALPRGDQNWGNGSGNGLWGGSNNRNFYSSYSGDHTHSLTINATGGGQPHENRPPYYALAFIMKL